MAVPMIVDNIRLNSGPTAAVNKFTIANFDARYEARRLGNGLAIDVTENITANFPTRNTNRGIERRLDGGYGGSDIRLSNFTVTDPSGKSIPFTKRTEDGDIILRIGRSTTYVYGRVNYVIKYTIGRAMVQASDRQEIYLDVNGTGWQQPFNAVRATLVVAPDLVGNLLNEQACYQGAAGSQQPCTITRSGNTFSTQQLALGPRQNMTIAIGFAQGTVQQTVPAVWTGLGWYGIIAMPVFAGLLLAVALVVRRTRLNNLLLRDDAAIQYTTPTVQPILAADFLGLPERGAAAQLTQLVLDGHATLASDDQAIGTAPQPRSRLSMNEKEAVRDLRVQLLKPDEIDRSVRTISKSLFGDGRSVPLGKVGVWDIRKASKERWDLLLGSGLRKQSWLGGTMFVIGYVALIGFGWAQLALGLRGLDWQFLGLGLLAVLLLVAQAHYYPALGRLTERGKELRDHLAGLHRFVTMAEADRIAWMQNAVDAPRVSGPDDGSLVKLYEPLLPYAIIFGVEDTWRQALGDRYDLAPTQTEKISDVAALTLVMDWATSSHYGQDYYRQDTVSHGFWDSRPSWGEGWVANTGQAMAEGFDSWASSRDDDSGGGWGSGGGSSSSSWSSSSSSSSGSSGGGSSGGGMGGGGGGGW